MKSEKSNPEDQTFSMNEIAMQLGITEDELFQFSVEKGLINPDGTPTEFALNEGLIKGEPEFNPNLN
jgi:hypothetical protein